MNDRLLSAITAAKHSPFYAARNLPTDDWNAIPVTSKDDLRSAYPFGMLAVPMRRVNSYHESSGTSGKPIVSLFTNKDWEDIVTRFLRNAVGLSSDDMVLVKTPYSLVTTAHQMHQAARFAGATVVPADNRTSNMPYSRVLRLLFDLPITVAWCLPTEVLLWAYVAKEIGLEPARDFPRLRAFLVAGESLSPAKKKMLSQLWGGKPIFEDYGSTETGSLAGECSQGKMHLWSDRVLFEVQDAQSGKIRLTGAGKLLVTPLQREAMPLLRYELGDQVVISPPGCACGSEFSTIEVSGRHSAALEIRGQTLYARDLEELVYRDFATTQILFWRARPATSGDALIIEIYSPQAGASEILRQTIADALGLKAEVLSVPASRFVQQQALARETPMQKPRFVFRADEDWEQNFIYA